MKAIKKSLLILRKTFRCRQRIDCRSEQSSLLSHIKRIINHLETLLDGCFLLELSNRTSDTILSFESYFLLIIAEALKQTLKTAVIKTAELIKTNSNFATVNFKLTNQLITDFLLRMKVKLS
jgi:aspartokinase/homoserine dehydrogenase 1